MLTVLALLACGLVAARAGAVPEATPRVLDRVVILFALPGLVLDRVPTLELDAAALVPIAVAWTQLVVLAALVALAARVRRWSPRTTGTLLLCVPLGNTSFLGFPAVEALLGADHVPFAVLYDQLGSFLALATWGTVVAARYGAGSTASAAAVLRRVVTFPAFVALVVAFAVRGTGLPGPVADVAAVLGATLTPLTMLSIGMRLRRPPTSALGPLVTGLTLRMAVAPLAVLGVAVALGVGGPAWDASVLEAAMPPMVTASIVAIDAGLDEQLATALTGAGILLALLSLPALALLL